MPYRYLTFLLLATLLGCQPDADLSADCGCPVASRPPDPMVSTDSLSNAYLDIWKRAFMKRNGINDATFRVRVRVLRYGLSQWDIGREFTVAFSVQMNWLAVPGNERFVVWYDPRTTHRDATNWSRGVYLSESQLQLASRSNRSVKRYDFFRPVAFQSCENACQTLRRKTGYATLKFSEVRDYSRYDDRYVYPVINAVGFVRESNVCMFGTADVLTGVVKAVEGSCSQQ